MKCRSCDRAVMFDLYRAARPLLFAIPPEAAHAVALCALNISSRLGLLSSLPNPASPIDLLGLRFSNRLGVAAGLDKDGVAIDALCRLGFGFVEVGTVTPKPQSGNARPRLFRLRDDRALINRMGFPNAGIEALATRLQQRTSRGLCGVNIGKNALTSLDEAATDYLTCLSAIYSNADYVAINVSSPNTSGLRRLQGDDLLSPLLSRMLEARNKLAREHNRVVPLLVKLTIDLGDRLTDAARTVHKSGIDGIIVTNTTTSRQALRYAGNEEGGLSGAPLLNRTIDALHRVRAEVSSTLPIIGVGGIASAADAIAVRRAGADLLQIYTALIYRGPQLINEILSALASE